MKKGFTLQEVLITLVVVGIVAAIAIPGMVGNMPSKDHNQLLKAYSTITRILENILDETSDMFDIDEDCADNILNCNLNPDLFGGNGILSSLNINELNDSNSKKLASLVYTNLSIKSGELGDTTFISTDGITWTFSDDSGNVNVTIGTEKYTNTGDITVQANGFIKPSDATKKLINESKIIKKKEFDKFANENNITLKNTK